MKQFRNVQFVLFSSVLCTAGTTALSQTSEPAFAGKTLQMIIGVGPGGGYDTWGRIVARYIGAKLPGQPSVVPRNMPGAGSIVAANYIYSTAPKDGTVLGILNRDAPLAQLTGSGSARYDATKFSWLGTPTMETNVCISSSRAKVKHIDQLRDMEIVLGGVGPGSGSYNYPKALSGLLDLKIKLISGFPGSNEVFLAMDRGEVDGMCESLDGVESKRPGAIKNKDLNVVFQGGLERSRELSGAPFIMDYARNDDERQVLTLLYAGQGLGRPFIAPPVLQEGRLTMLRQAFDATMIDAEFNAEAKKLRLDVDPRSGSELEELVRKIYAAPKHLVQRLSDVLK